jgi:hypothetical protein
MLGVKIILPKKILQTHRKVSEHRRRRGIFLITYSQHRASEKANTQKPCSMLNSHFGLITLNIRFLSG